MMGVKVWREGYDGPSIFEDLSESEGETEEEGEAEEEGKGEPGVAITPHRACTNVGTKYCRATDA